MRARDPGHSDGLIQRHRPLMAVALRFLLGGAVNTLATLLLYWLLLRFMHYQWAYLASFCAGILLSYALNTRYVFKAKHSWLRFAAFPLIYLIVYGLGAMTLRITVGHWGVPPALGPILSIIVTLPVSFLLTRALLKPDPSDGSLSGHKRVP